MESTRKSNSNSRLIVVLGMHRSGTSAVTKSLELFGVGLGDNLHPAGFDNPKGFWEDRECIEINDELLSHLNSAYDSLGMKKWDDIKIDLKISELRTRAILLLSRKLVENNGIWGFKDPRTSRLLHFWDNVFVEVGCEVSFVMSIRNPVSVVASLAERNNMAAEKIYFLWLQHTLLPLGFMKDSRHVIVDYDELLANPYAQLVRISAAFGMSLPDRQHPQIKNYENNFIDNELRHTCFTAEEIELDSRASTMVMSAYSLLHRIAIDQESLGSSTSQVMINNLNVNLCAINPAFDYINFLEGDCIGLNQAIVNRDESISFLMQKEDAREQEIFKLHQQILEREERGLNLIRTVAEQEESINSLMQKEDDREQEVFKLHQKILEREERILNLVQIVAEQDEKNRSLIQELELREQQTINIFKIYHHLHAGIKRLYVIMRRTVSNSSRTLWHVLPLSVDDKHKLKASIFRSFSWVFRRTKAYQAWRNLTAPFSEVSQEGRIDEEGQKVSHDEYVPLFSGKSLEKKTAKLICFYLPQYHPIPENDEWWGEGFTEWTNVIPAKPQFEGHYQPHVPSELGYYNVLDSGIQQQQVELAKLYGIEGFCFYFYWFAGKRLLEAPIQKYLDDASLDLPFCLCWANENWSRTWDGLDKEILIAQQYSTNDDLAFIQYISNYMLDSRYIRIDGKPLLLVYRPNLLPSAKETAARWRDWCRNNGIGEIYLAYTQSFETVDPAKYGFDAAIEFPPNNSAPPNVTDSVKPLSGDFGCTVYDWQVFVERSKKYTQSKYTLFRSVCPAWDNTARRKNSSTIFMNSTPALYQRWLKNAISDTLKYRTKPDERLVFVNAWNEWAEGAHLEPDEKYGYAYLQATRNALEQTSNNVTDEKMIRRIVLVAHDAYPHGAQYLILNMAKVFHESMGFKVDMIVMGEGPLIKEYSKYATIHKLINTDPEGDIALNLVRKLSEQGATSAITNTAVTGMIIPVLKQCGFTAVSLIHELPQLIKEYKLEKHVKTIAREADKIVFAARAVMTGFELFSKLDETKVVIRPQGLYKKSSLQTDEKIKSARKDLRKKFNIPENSTIVLGVGFADYRKGIDIFVDSGINVIKNNNNVYFIWLGKFEPTIEKIIKKTIDVSGLNDHFIFPGLDYNSDIYYAGSDIYALTSREDPFPSVVMEALDAFTPVIAFSKSGGSAELLTKGGGVLVDEINSIDFSSALNSLINNPEMTHQLGCEGKKIIDEDFSFRKYLFDLAELAKTGLRRVSVIVPNYNYEQYIHERLHSITAQNYPIYEIIILDDASSDNSRDVIKDFIQKQKIDCSLIINTKNSGSVFSQWKKGIDASSGDYSWIAEADDLSEPGFLNEVMEKFDDPSIVISYCESKQMDSSGNILCDNYLEYVRDISCVKWLCNYKEKGINEITSGLAIKNTIPNVSAVVFKRDIIESVLQENIELIKQYKNAGDWLTYTYVLRHGDISYSSKSLNKHRRHRNSITISGFGAAQLNEISRVQKKIRDEFHVDIASQRKAHEYLELLYKQFGLDVSDDIFIDKS